MVIANKLLIAHKVLSSVVYNKKNLTESLSLIPKETDNKAFIAEVCFGVCRYYHHLLWLQSELLDKPLKEKDEPDIRLCLCLGLYQLLWMSVPAAVVVNNSVELIKELKKSSAQGLVNACLRRFIAKQGSDNCFPSKKTHFSHPKWFAKLVARAWQDKSDAILEANNKRAPMVLRVNQQKISRVEYLDLLDNADIKVSSTSGSPESITLEKHVAVVSLPKFLEGFISVQSQSAQWAAHLLELEPKLTVLDACSAPGMKATHLLECEPSLKLDVLELNEKRAKKIKENFSRLQLYANLLIGDATSPSTWWDGKQFDRILCDAPCSATGVIRKHPDIKVLRSKEEFEHIVKIQALMLRSLWPLLKKGGIFLYATCSILPAENEEQISQFLEETPNAKSLSLPKELGEGLEYGVQRFPYQSEGFYYAKLQKIK